MMDCPGRQPPFSPVGAARAHTETALETELLWKTRRAPERPREKARTEREETAQAVALSVCASLNDQKKTRTRQKTMRPRVMPHGRSWSRRELGSRV